MEQDTPDKFEQFSTANYQPLFREPTNTETSENSNFTSQEGLNPYYNNLNRDDQSNAKWSNQVKNTSSNQWNLSNVQNNNRTNIINQQSLANKNINGFEFTPQEAKLIRDCNKQGFWFFSVPSVVGFICLRQYNSVKNLKPFTLPALIWQSIFVYFGTKILWTPVCWGRLLNNNPDFLQRIERLKKDVTNYRSQSLYSDSFNESNSQNVRKKEQSTFKPQNSPYLQSPFTFSQQRQQSNKEFVDDNYDVSHYGKETN